MTPSMMATKSWVGVLAVIAVFAMHQPIPADDWPNYRGPNHNGISAESRWTDHFSDGGPRIAWRSNVGVGFSSVAISDGLVFTLGNSDDQESLFCIDSQTGKNLWKHSYECSLDDRFFEGGPTSTPTVDSEKVYSMSRQGDLFCFDKRSGKIIWSKNVRAETDVRVPGWGFASSPVIHGDRLILGVGEAGLALDKHNGEVIWKSGAGEAGYMTPLPFQLGNRWFALIASGKFYQCVDLENGLVVWRHRWLTTYGCNAASPIVVGSQAFFSSGYGRGAVLVDLSEDSCKVVWSNKEMQNQLNSSLLLDGMIYGFDGDEGGDVQLKCMEFATGAEKWSLGGLGSGSLTAANNRLIVLSQSGELVIAPATPEGFALTSRAKVLDGKCWTAPVLCNGFIYCRNAAGDIVCLDVQTQPKE